MDLREVAARGLRPAIDLHVTALLLGIEAVASPACEPWAASARAALGPAQRAAFAPMAADRAVPDVLLALEHRRLRPAERLHLLREAPRHQVLAQIGGCSRSWDAVTEAPERWLGAVAAAIGRLQPLARALLASERVGLRRLVSRVRAATAPETVGRIVRQLHCEATIDDAGWHVPDVGPALRLPDDGLMVIPTLLPPDRAIVAAPEGQVTALIGGATTRARNHRAFDALVGPVRARVLRLLDDPLTMTALARLLDVAPSLSTHHVDALEHMELVCRRRRGRFVAVRRTARGDELLRLYQIAPLGSPAPCVA